jgi:hypothetical protein
MIILISLALLLTIIILVVLLMSEYETSVEIESEINQPVDIVVINPVLNSKPESYVFKRDARYDDYDKLWEESMRAEALAQVQREFPNDKVTRTGPNTITVGQWTE